ncbi:MAG: DUF6607 family protein [Pseudomonadota bacterium]
MSRLWFVALGFLALGACATSDLNEVGDARTSASSSFERDRAAILAMAGTYDVTFDFIETVSLHVDYDVKDRKLSGATEVVLVVEDLGDFISLQHILLMGRGERAFVLKHWRQDWRYEPEDVLTFIGGNAWTMTDVSRAQAKGAWSQQVYQVDDSPRYGGVGRWSYDNGVPAWTPALAWRPLPRRDMTTRDDYHAVEAVNRHAITPRGWVHEQDNTKVVLSTGEPQALVREIAVNTYARSDTDASAVFAQWDATKEYWQGVRAIWTAFEAEGQPYALTLKGEPQELYMPLLSFASQVEKGEMTTKDAVVEARKVIETYTTTTLPPLTERLR